MALPGGVSTASITFGPYTDLLGNVTFVGLKGTLKVSPPMVDVNTGSSVLQPIDFVINSDGTATVGPAVANDDPAVVQGTEYSVTWQVASYKPSPGNKTFVIPRAAGATVDFDLLTATTPGSPYSLPLVTSVNGHSGAVTLGAADVGADAAGAATAAQSAAVAAAATDATTKASAAQVYAVQRANHTGTQSADTLTDGTTNKAFLATERAKLTGVATGATANSTDTALRDRSTHTGTQAATTITGLGAAVVGDATVIAAFDAAGAAAAVSTATTTALAAKQDAATLGATVAADATVKAAFGTVLNLARYCNFDGSDETTKMAQALSDAAGNTLWIPRGKTVKTSTIRPAGGTTITGGGTIDLIDDGTSQTVSVYVNGVDGVTLDGITIKSSNATGRTSNYGLVRAVLATNLTVQNCVLGKCSSTLIWTGQCDGVLISNNRGGGNYADGIHLSRGTTNARVIGNDLNGCKDDGIAVNSLMADGGTGYGACTDITIVGNTVRGITVAGNGIAVNGGQRVTISGNTVVHPVSNGININLVSSGGQQTFIPSDVTVTGNTVRQVASPNVGINVGGISGSSFPRITIANNTIDTASAADAIYAAFMNFSSVVGNAALLASDKAGVHLSNCQYSSVSNNTTLGGGGTSTGINVTGSAYISIQGNVANNCQVGIFEQTSTAPILVLGNIVQGNTSSAVGGTPLATSIYRANVSYNPRGVQTVAVPASGVPITAVHYDRVFYITAASSTVGVTVGGASVATVPANTLGTIRVPAGQTMTPAYSSAPTWVAYGE